MYSVSEKFKDQIISDDREFSVALTFHKPTERTLTGTTIQSISVDEIVNSTDTLTLGCACSNKIVVNLIEPPTDIDYENAVFTAKLGLKVDGEYEYVPLGKYYVSDAESKNDFKNLTLTAYDGFCKMTDTYDSGVSEATTLQAVYNDLKAQLEGYEIILRDAQLPSYDLTFPYIENLTYQKALGYVAGCLGGFARFDREGNLEIATYTDSGIEIDRSLQYMNGFKRLTKKFLSITSIATGTQSNPIVRGNGANGTEINFENPYITDAMADDVYADFLDLTYTPCQVKWRGNPAVQAGDIVTAVDGNGESHFVLVMSQNIKIGGGLNSTIDCKGNSETKSNFSNSFETTGQKIERAYTTLEKAILDATNAITGNSGGYVKVIDTNGDTHPDEIVIMDTDDISTATNVWRWNKEGLGHSSNGYGGPYKDFAITADGKINADYIVTGTLNADRIAVENFDADDPTKITDYIRFADGTITLGKGDSTLTLKLENNQVAFYSGDTRIAYFSNNSFEIENLTEGKIRFANFGFIPRASGNLTFTLLQ